MDSIIDITSSNPNVYLSYSIIQEQLLTVSDYDYIYHITDDLIEYSPLPSPPLSPSPAINDINLNVQEETKTNVKIQKGSIKKNRAKTKSDLVSMKIKDLNIYIKDNNLNREEIRKIKKQRRRALNCIYARKSRSKKELNDFSD